MAAGRKTGGRKKGSKNKATVVRPEVLPPETAESVLAETARAVVLTTAPVRTPKAVMLDAMIRFENLGLGFLTRAERLMKRGATVDKVQAEAMEGHKFIVAAVECAMKAAPYVHARLLAVESRGDMTQDEAPFVIRVPTVLGDSTVWQAAVGSEILDIEAAQAASRPRPEVSTPSPATDSPARPDAPATTPAVLTIDQKTSQITAMPPGPKVVKPSGTEEWLAGVMAERRKAAG